MHATKTDSAPELFGFIETPLINVVDGCNVWVQSLGTTAVVDCWLMASTTLACVAPAGVFDGHGHEGRLAASFAAREVPKHLAADARVAGGASNKQWTAAFTEACVAVRSLSPLLSPLCNRPPGTFNTRLNNPSTHGARLLALAAAGPHLIGLEGTLELCALLQAHTAMGLKPLAGFDAEYSGTTACMALLNEVRGGARQSTGGAWRAAMLTDLTAMPRMLSCVLCISCPRAAD